MLRLCRARHQPVQRSGGTALRLILVRPARHLPTRSVSSRFTPQHSLRTLSLPVDSHIPECFPYVHFSTNAVTTLEINSKGVKPGR